MTPRRRSQHQRQGRAQDPRPGDNGARAGPGVAPWITISGTNFEPFSVPGDSEMIGGRDATPSGAETDKNGGTFEIDGPGASPRRGQPHRNRRWTLDRREQRHRDLHRVGLTPVVSTPQEVFGVTGRQADGGLALRQRHCYLGVLLPRRSGGTQRPDRRLPRGHRLDPGHCGRRVPGPDPVPRYHWLEPDNPGVTQSARTPAAARRPSRKEGRPPTGGLMSDTTGRARHLREDGDRPSRAR